MSYTESQLEEEQKLVWAGLKQPQRGENQTIKLFEELEELLEDIDEFDGDLEDVADLDEFEDYLIDIGFDAEDAEEFRQQVEQQFGSIEDFKDEVAKADSIQELINKFDELSEFAGEAETEDGDKLAAIRIHDNGGISQNGVVLPEGTVEVIGRRIEFSQSDPPRAEDGEVTFSNLTTDSNDNVETNLSTVEISVDVSNSNSGARLVSVALTRDGSVVAEQNVEVPATSTETVTFTESHSDVCYDYEIETEGPVTVCWVHPGLVR